MSKLLGAVALALAPFPALAGGLGAVATEPVVAPVSIVPAPVAEPCCFDGFYIGGQVAQGTSALPSFVLPEGDGSLYGLHAGYNRAFGKLVLGGEVDLNTGSVVIEVAGGDNLDLDRLTRARLRLGYDLGRIMPYVSAGVASVHMVDGPLELSGSGTVYTVGAEYCLSDRVTLGAEYSDHTFADFKEVGGTVSDLELQTLGLRASWHF